MATKKKPATRKPVARKAAPAKKRVVAKSAPVKKAEAKASKGRPSLYTPQLGARICEMLIEGKSLRTVCKLESMPHCSTVMRWLADDGHKNFREQYARAREAQAELYADETIELSDNLTGDAARDRLRFDARRWYASKLAPKKYGDKVTQEITGAGGGPIETRELSDTERAVRLAALIARAKARAPKK